MEKLKVSTVTIHLVGWLLFLSFPIVFTHAGESSSDLSGLLFNSAYWEFCICYFLLFYFNSLILIPRLFLEKKYLIYAFIIFILFVSVYFLKPFDRLLNQNSSAFQGHNKAMRMEGEPPDFERQEMPPDHQDGPMRFKGMPPEPQRKDRPFRNTPFPDTRSGTYQYHKPPPGFGPPPEGGRMRHIDTTSIFMFIMVVALSTAIEITRKWNLTESRALLAEAGKANAELSFLKAQINPHFLFNTLNNIYTLAVTDSEHTADSIMKLSNIMRYVTDEVSEDFVLLQNEIDCIENYIDLQRLRIGKTTEIEYSVTGNTSNKVVAPLIFMTFIENIFKYGISKQDHSKLIIRINILSDHINLFCQNSIYNTVTADSRKGIGIQNTRQRLEHLYPGKQVLKIDSADNLYTVDLTLYN